MNLSSLYQITPNDKLLTSLGLAVAEAKMLRSLLEARDKCGLEVTLEFAEYFGAAGLRCVVRARDTQRACECESDTKQFLHEWITPSGCLQC